jgi:hypothetical protein
MNGPLILPATGLLLALTACGGGSGSTTAAPATGAVSGGVSGAGTPSTPASVATSPAADPSTDASSGAVDVCALLPASDVSRITGVHYTKTKSTSVMNQFFGCEYTNSRFALLQVSLAVTNGSIAYDADVQAMSGTGHAPDPVSGVGDKAFATQDPQGNAGAAGVAAFASYGALFGDQYVKIGGSYVTPDQGEQLVEEVDGGL